jgi:uncharacterized protein (TIGR00730 family)
MNILIYCGARLGNDPLLQTTVERVGQAIVDRRWNLVYGGGGVGLMGIVARTVLQGGGHVTGIIPTFLNTAEVALNTCTVLHEVESMHERKQQMIAIADIIVALPGGYGTLDELFEALTWRQLGLHACPIGLLNVDGFYDSILALRDEFQRRSFIDDNVASMLTISDSIDTLFDALRDEHMSNGGPLPTQLERG